MASSVTAPATVRLRSAPQPDGAAVPADRIAPAGGRSSSTAATGARSYGMELAEPLGRGPDPVRRRRRRDRIPPGRRGRRLADDAGRRRPRRRLAGRPGPARSPTAGCCWTGSRPSVTPPAGTSPPGWRIAGRCGPAPPGRSARARAYVPVVGAVTQAGLLDLVSASVERLGDGAVIDADGGRGPLAAAALPPRVAARARRRRRPGGLRARRRRRHRAAVPVGAVRRGAPSRPAIPAQLDRAARRRALRADRPRGTRPGRCAATRCCGWSDGLARSVDPLR